MSKRKQLFVDGQVLQTTARDRGMGRYCICLIRALIELSECDVTVIFTTRLPLQEQNKAELEALFEGAQFTTLDLWTADKHGLEAAVKHNEQTLTKYIGQHASEGAAFFIPSLFQEPLAPVFPSCDIIKSLLFHDLIPYLYHLRYQSVMLWENYLKRFKHIFEADIIFTNSQTVADDLNMYLGVPKTKLCRIDGAAIHVDSRREKPSHIDTSKKFILFNTSDDPRKNNLRTVLAFEEFRKASGRDYNLVLTSHFNKRECEQLQRFCGHLQFTGSIHERQLNWLYDRCEFVLFTPESEGLGLPALEAIDAGKKVVCSSITVLREISTDAFYYCDYRSGYSIAQAIMAADDPKAPINKEAYRTIQEYYSWPQTAARMMAGLRNFKPTAESTRKPKIAIMVATPGGLSGVGLTSAILHPTLSEHFDIDYYLERGLSNASVRPNYLQYVAPCYPASSFSAQRYAQYDAVFYHMGNGDYHLESITSALTMPGYLIVHDTTLLEAYRVMREIGMMGEDRVQLEARMDEVRGTKKSSYYTSLANRQLGILVHSQYAEEAMCEVLEADVPIARAGLPTTVPDLENTHDHAKITIGLAGAIADVKGLDIIEAIAEDPQFASCDIRLFGFNHASPEKLAKLNGYENVTVATNVSDFDFQNSFSQLDIFVNYRLVYKGETSNTTLEAMRQGVVSIVRNVGWYSELDDKAAVKVESPEDVMVALRELIKDKKRMRAIGVQAKAYVSRYFTGEQYAAAMQQLLQVVDSKNPNAQKASKLKKGKA